MNVVCESAKTCGILSQSSKVGKKEVVVYGCNHAKEHEHDWRCKSGYCSRIAPNSSKCSEVVVPVVAVAEPIVETVVPAIETPVVDESVAPVIEVTPPVIDATPPKE